jgi:prophage tail gpP-like protein
MIEIAINGTPYKLFKSITFSRSIDNASGAFSITTSSSAPNTFPINRGDVISISINGISKLYGFIDDIDEDGDNESHTIIMAGRDNTCDLIDSSVPDGAKVIEDQISLKAMCEKVISELGIQMQVEDNSGQTNIFSEDDLQAAESGDAAMDYLQSYARKKQVFLTPSGDGKLVIFRPGNIIATTDLIHRRNNNGNNVKRYRVKQSQQARFNQYYVRSQDNIGFFDDADYGVDGTKRTGIVTDDSIRAGRYLEIVAEESMDDATCLERAKEEANVRRARSTSYSCVVAGTSMADGTPWDIGQTVTVNDEIANVRGSFIIRSVEYSQDSDSGTQTNITCAPIDAYKVQPLETAGDKRVSSMPLQSDTPPEQVRPRR